MVSISFALISQQGISSNCCYKNTLGLMKSLIEHLVKLLLNVVLNRLREQLAARGATTIRGLGRSFKLFDSYDGNRKADG